jgi:hypothetical protein
MVEYKSVSLGLITPSKNNARNHSKEQIKLLAESIREFGFVNPLIIDEDNRLLAGHGRYLAAQRLRLSEAPCICLVGLSERQKQAYMIADNKLGERSEWDRKTLNGELAELLLSGVNLEVMGVTKGEIAALTISDEWLERNATGDIRQGDIWDMLSYSPSLNKKRSIRFLSCFNWISTRKKDAIQEFRRLKDDCSSEFVGQVAAEIYDLVSPVVSGLDHNDSWRVTSPPGKQKRELHFATEIAKAVADLFQIKHEQAFKPRLFNETSTPRNYKKREQMQLRPGLERSNWLLVDDVATSGNTLEGCLAALKPNGSAIAAVLIYEETAKW